MSDTHFPWWGRAVIREKNHYKCAACEHTFYSFRLKECVYCHSTDNVRLLKTPKRSYGA